MTSKFVSIMNKIGHDIKVAWEDVVKYLPLASSLAAAIFPAQTASIDGVVSAVSLIQQVVVAVEQKFAAAGAPTGSGPQKVAQVLSIVGPAVTQLLAAEGLHYNQAQIQNIINIVVGILNVQAAPGKADASTNEAAPQPA